VISKRGLAAATATGAGLVLLATGAASACSLSDYHAKAACDSSLGQAAITVTNDYPGYTATDLTVLDANGAKVGSGILAKDATTITIDVPWAAKGSWTVQVAVEDQQYSYANGKLAPVSAGQATCGSAPTATPTPTPPASPVPSPSAGRSVSPSAAPSSTTVAVVATSPASSSTPTATLAETGSSGTGMLATLAGVLVAAGGGALYFLRRRSAGSHS
jgi:LPXTG-motif cell wall-anchored protein